MPESQPWYIIWGVTCGPCRVEMPRWSELLRERPDLRLVVIHADLVPGEAKAIVSQVRISIATRASGTAATTATCAF